VNTPAVRGIARVAALLSALLLMAAADAPHSPLLREQAWTAHSDMLAYDLTHAPGECLAARTAQSEIGRALFRSPALFGGPAARVGLSCQACHANGRANARFLLPELTDRAGAADVTSEWGSRVRGDGVMNPVAIPDLAGVGRRSALGHARDPSLEHFVRSVIVDEFQGVEPPAQAFEGVVAYLRALDADACPAGPAPVTLAGAADDVRRALDAAENADAPTARLVLLAAQDAMGRIAERLPARRFGLERRRLESLSRELGAMRRAEDVGAALATALPGWRPRFDAVATRIGQRESRTYFNEAALRAALGR
jgi:hypothetical protein